MKMMLKMQSIDHKPFDVPFEFAKDKLRVDINTKEELLREKMDRLALACASEDLALQPQKRKSRRYGKSKMMQIDSLEVEL